MHLLAGASLFALPLSPFLLLFFCLPLLWSAWAIFRPAKTSALRLDSALELGCCDLQGCWQEMEILPGSTVFPYLIVLRLRARAAGEKQNLVLLPDQLPREAFRRLQLCLRWRATAAH